MKSNKLDSSDDFLSWIKYVNRRLQRLERRARTDLLSSTPDGSFGELAVRTADEIPEDIPLDAHVYVIDQQVTLVRDPVSREWQQAP